MPPAANRLLPGPAGPAGGGAGALGCRDATAPVSRFITPRLRVSRARITLRGTSGDRGCRGAGRLVRVTVAIGRAVGSRCRFLRADGSFGPRVSCLRTPYLQARGTKRWSFAQRVRLPRGAYKVFVRGIDAAGNVERKQRTRNFARLRVR